MAFIADPRLDSIPTHKLERWSDRPVRRTFPRLERTLIRLSRLSGAGRRLNEFERNLLERVFGDSLLLDPVRVVETRWLNAPTVLGNGIRVRPGYLFSERNAAILVHEAMHLWQYQHNGTGYISDSVFHNARSLWRTGRRDLAYLNYQLSPESRLEDFTSEQQATIVADFFQLTHVFADPSLAPSWVISRRPALPIYQRLMREVRDAGQPSA